MANNKGRDGFILDHLSHEYTSDSIVGHNGKNDESALSPEEAAAKIWGQWMQCRLLSAQWNVYFEYKINNPE